MVCSTIYDKLKNLDNLLRSSCKNEPYPLMSNATEQIKSTKLALNPIFNSMAKSHKESSVNKQAKLYHTKVEDFLHVREQQYNPRTIVGWL